MTMTECRDAAEGVMKVYENDRARAAMRELRARNASPEEYVQALAAFADPEIAPTIRREFMELPALTISVIMETWHLAETGNKRFEVVSMAPDKAIEFARKKRVRVAVEAEEDAARVVISHVATRHASWYSPAAVSA